ncbi:MAG: hypothetical protein KC731_26270, partial [Myxococcales bacterium]|nr:hypothetical protein [Myxococcales bacterium]
MRFADESRFFGGILRRRAAFVFGAAFVLSWLSCTTVASAREPAAESLPPPPVRLRIVAPSASGPWLLRIDNEADQKVRVAADVRLLSFDVQAPASRLRGSVDGGWTRHVTHCDGPADFSVNHFPIDRELVLEPGQSYVEQFDPRLICFGKDADLLVPGARVKPYLGWKPRSGKSELFAVDAAARPRAFRPLRRLAAPTLVLSYADPVVYGPPPGSGEDAAKGEEAAAPSEDPKGSRHTPPGHHRGRPPGPPSQPPEGGAEIIDPPPGIEGHTVGERRAAAKSAEEATKHRPKRRNLTPRPPPPPSDDLAARMTLTTTHYSDAGRPTEVALSVQAHNAGERPVFVALRSRMLSFRVEGPDGAVECRRPSVDHAVPRDLFHKLQQGKHIHMDVLLAEVCPPGTFDRPGL